MLKAIAEARDTHAKQARANGVSHIKVLIAPALMYPARDDPTAALDLNMLPQAAFQALPNGSKKVLSFLASFRWCLAPNGQQGVSWMELLIVFCAQGGLPADLGISTDMGPRPSLRTVLLAFSRSVEKALTPMYLAQHSQIFFKPSKFAQRRCRSIGYTNHCACIAGLPNLGPEQAISVTQAVISLRHTFTRNSEKLHHDGQLQLPPRKFIYRGALPENWSALKCSVSVSQHIAGQADQWLQSIQLPGVPEISTLKLHCPVCNVAKECKNHTLLKGTKWCSILCVHCHRAKTSAKWQCSCNKHWYLCPTHGPIGHVAGAGKAEQPRQPASASVSLSGHCRHQPSAPELPMPVEPRPKRHKADDSNGHSCGKRQKRRSSTQGPLHKRRKQEDGEAIAAIQRLRDARTQAMHPRIGMDLDL